MFPPPAPPEPPSPAARSAEPERQRAGLIVLAVALAVLLSGVGLVWYLNARGPDDGQRRSAPAVVPFDPPGHRAGPPT